MPKYTVQIVSPFKGNAVAVLAKGYKSAAELHAMLDYRICADIAGYSPNIFRAGEPVIVVVINHMRTKKRKFRIHPNVVAEEIRSSRGKRIK